MQKDLLEESKALIGILTSLILFVLVWQFAISPYMREVFFPPPSAVFNEGIRLIRKGTLFYHVGMSLFRVAIGFSLGSLIAIPIGLLMGEIKLVRSILEPYVNFFRCVPPIAYISLAIIWFGIGESAKFFLIVYTTVFSVIINTYFGVSRIPQNRFRAALSLGGTRTQLFLYVTIPGAMPYILTGMRIAMGQSFMTIIAAEMLAADQGLGFMIYNARLFMLTHRIFLGIILLGIVGILLDKTFRFLIQKFAGKFTAETV